jgi:glycosyltransferase involved in cell wall biosynthesis
MGYKFLVNTITDWNEPPRARHQVAQALSGDHEVIFVTKSVVGLPGLRIFLAENKMKVVTPSFPYSAKIRIRIGWLNTIYQYWLFRKLKKLHQDSVVINFDFTANHLHQFFSRSIYYCNDDHLAMSYKFNPGWIARYQDRCEKVMAEESTFCVGTSEYLTSKLKKKNHNSFEIRLGAPEVEDAESLSRYRPKSKVPVNVGIVGYLDTIDTSLLNHIVSLDELEITAVGPISEKKKMTLKNRERIRFTGSLEGNDLFMEVGRFDVGLIPYKLDSSIERTPNKLWLYLALGKPVVISNIKAIRKWAFPDYFVYRSDSTAEFIELIKRAREEDNPELVRARIDFAKRNSWSMRMEKLLQLVEEHMKNDYIT